jgi:hypothetical protein
MAKVQSNWAKGVIPMPTPTGGEVVNVTLTLAVASTETALNDIYEMGALPAGCVLVDATFAATDLDTAGSPANVMSFGVVNAGGTDLDTTLQASLTIGQGGTAARLTPTRDTMLLSGAKKLGYKVTTASGTGAAGTVYLNLSYRNA